MKVASIVSRAPMTDDSGRALSIEWQLFLNDNGGAGYWHGGPGFPTHCSVYNSEKQARDRAAKLGYEVTGVRWS